MDTNRRFSFGIFVAVAVVALALVMVPRPAAAQAVPGDVLLVRFRNDVTANQIARIHASANASVRRNISGIDVDVVSVPSGTAASAVAVYRQHSEVAYVELDSAVQAVDAVTVNDPAYATYQWGLPQVHAAEAWGVTTGLASVRIAVLDTGIDTSHPDLAGKVVATANFTSSTTLGDVYGHGTHVAGIAAAATNNGIGVAGLGFNSTLQSVKVLGDDGSGYLSWVASGVVWATDHGARVINMSLGTTASSSTLQDAVSYAWSRGVVVVAAAGNNANSTPFYPAAYSNVIAVAATDSADQLATFSNYGSWVSVAAPGVNIYSTLKAGGYGYKSGTSMASPLVAGLAALEIARAADKNGSGYTNDEVRSCLSSGADPIASTGTGSGRVNAFRSVSCAAAATTPTTGSIAGVVKNSATNAPIAGASVSAGAAHTTTDTTGAYTLSGLAAGTYTVTAAASGYSTASQSAGVTAGATATANFLLVALTPPPTASMWVQSIAFARLGSNVRVTFTVMGVSGPVGGAALAATITGPSGELWTASGTTNSSGVMTYTISKGAGGNYSARVTALTASGYTWDTTRGVTSGTGFVAAQAKSVGVVGP